MARDKLTYIEIAGYKSISANQPLSLAVGDVTVLLGANGTGKSNIVGFFRMLNYMMSGSLQRYVAENGTNQAFLHYGPQHTPSLRGKLEFQKETGVERYEFELSQAAGQRLIITSESVEWQRARGGRPLRFRVDSDFRETGLINSEGRTEKIIHRLLSQCKAFQFHDTSQTGPLRQASKVHTAQYLQSAGNNLASFLHFLKENHEQEYRRIVSYVRMIMPHFGDFYLEPLNDYVSLNWRDASGSDYVFCPDQFSDGTIRFIALATLLLQPVRTMPSVIIVDEPELGLHPYALEQLAQLIKDASVHAQIVIATQSPQLIDGFDVGDVTVVEQDDAARTTVARKLNEEELRFWLEEYTVSELWRKNVIGGQPL
ncbi:MAG: AAA family ATPase [Bacteroidaceae bacterium]|nr:AAA family ATPase [Bacteroidaceae bacterium]